ncbi:preprotein translocase subunit YajC [Cellulomonas shaoxiangyii]|uniref:Preprotein translocase subunit YajC n=1 Tax=Cellulomonas shaoxiangyii TaxID=2566013 RepID=A0A4P7SHI5_9CELL|nr:preprotein translocase subunit YajC [Cellulomonas shaoxiangyii]QCB93669.1 preprotein translocase subunit YajC [Cellulomonas shaoxiangyii]TGY86150.1 preprotein translocase subunit YajC [Cellulomonas shaoxiangyii]
MDYSFLIILLVAFAALWFMSSRTRKQQREMADLRTNLQVGDEVMTGSGLFGTVTAVEGDVVTLESTPGSETRWLKAAIARRVDPPVVDDVEVAEEDPSDADERDRVIEVPDDLSSLPPENPRRDDDTDRK